ncbi:hypothetical protein [Inconstantimicrobium porci]|uniref:hypothetical protein n=1 Tax=Inconstantimicrobium porci TaxID=2652291 RepID=UPI00240A371C|nr:hypothetical protein [Inconstantimicrobium porci]MDD6769674.1 hypothetical protein [Inconstantimicrobium porci]
MVNEIESATDIDNFKKAILSTYGDKWKENIVDIIFDMRCPPNIDKGLCCKGKDCFKCCKRFILRIMEHRERKGNILW